MTIPNHGNYGSVHLTQLLLLLLLLLFPFDTVIGEVILFAAAAVETMGNDGLFVLLEGREQTVNYVRTPFRFILELSDPSLIGKRRAAQRLMADALEKMQGQAATTTTPSHDDIVQVLEASLAQMGKEVP
jgi:hypothetical protein